MDPSAPSEREEELIEAERNTAEALAHIAKVECSLEITSELETQLETEQKIFDEMQMYHQKMEEIRPGVSRLITKRPEEEDIVEEIQAYEQANHMNLHEITESFMDLDPTFAPCHRFEQHPHRRSDIVEGTRLVLIQYQLKKLN